MDQAYITGITAAVTAALTVTVTPKLLKLLYSDKKVANSKLRNFQSFTVQGNPDQVYKTILAVAKDSNYSVGFADPDTHRILLKQSGSWANIGYRYPIRLSPASSREVQVTMGAMSDMGADFGPAAKRALTRTMDKFKETLAKSNGMPFGSGSGMGRSKRSTERLEWRNGEWARGDEDA
jgi:hypothetical protein